VSLQRSFRWVAAQTVEADGFLSQRVLRDVCLRPEGLGRVRDGDRDGAPLAVTAQHAEAGWEGRHGAVGMAVHEIVPVTCTSQARGNQPLHLHHHVPTLRDHRERPVVRGEVQRGHPVCRLVLDDRAAGAHRGHQIGIRGVQAKVWRRASRGARSDRRPPTVTAKDHVGVLIGHTGTHQRIETSCAGARGAGQTPERRVDTTRTQEQGQQPRRLGHVLFSVLFVSASRCGCV